MKQVTIRAAKTNLSKLIDAALAGEDVVIAKGSKPVVRPVPIRQSGFKLGLLEGMVSPPPHLLEPMSEEDLKLWEGG